MKWALWSLALGAGLGCSTTYDPYYYDDAYYDPYYGAYDAAWSYAWIDPVYGSWYLSLPALPRVLRQQANTDPNAAAAQLAANANAAFTPAGCATATASGATVNYTFNNCTAAISLTQISGNVQVALSNNQGQLAATATSNNLSINGEPYTLSMQIVASPPQGDQRKVTITSNSFSPAHLDSRSNQGTVTWVAGSGCITVDSQAQSTRGSLSSTTTVSGYQRCDHQCPTAGSVQVHTSEGTFTTTFNGSNSVQVSAPNGDTRSFNLNC
ncbi:hypothetical protein [Corallococcus sp. EGB]|uniref:hypothetical protein n=1 Tax=Corallococcus sp. EGB TaxID=1521117 RepID=UPI001CBD00FA|nr:hypothetical protein [Corallococcus sp. EGB]